VSVRRLTPAGTGGVAVVGVSGARDMRQLEKLLSGPLPSIGRAKLMRITEDLPDASHLRRSGWMDEALVLRRGSEQVELCLHGNPLLVSELIAELESEDGAGTLEQAGSVEAAAWQRLPNIRSESGARTVLDQAQGALRREALAWARGELAGPASWIDVQRRCAALLDPPLVVLAGASNAGKSTLFNLLLGEERVVVSAEQGTTRDTISAPLVLEHWVIQLVDTAGSRVLSGSSTASPESEGQRLANELAARADLVLELVSLPELAGCDWPGLEPEPGRRVLVSRADALGDELVAASNIQAFSAAGFPQHARALVGETILAGLGCRQSGSAWQAGRAVPLEGWRAQALDEARGLPAGDVREQQVLRILDGDT